MDKNEDLLFAPLSDKCLQVKCAFRRVPAIKNLWRTRWWKLAEMAFARCTRPDPKSTRPWITRGMRFASDRVIWRFQAGREAGVDREMQIRQKSCRHVDQMAATLLFILLNLYAHLSKLIGTILEGLARLMYTYSLKYSVGVFSGVAHFSF